MTSKESVRLIQPDRKALTFGTQLKGWLSGETC